MRDKKIPTARRLRQRETDFERRLWRELRNRRALGCVPPPTSRRLYIVDFACLEARLLVEIDGYWHQFRKAQDEARECELRATGFDIVRYDIEATADVRALAEAIAHEARLRIER